MSPEWLWDDPGVAASVARLVLTPASWAYRTIVAGRNALFDRGWLTTRDTALPALAVGNLSVGGTGKTPIAADLSRRLRLAGGAPALILRGYGDDEPRVHALLNPDVPVLTSADRVAASREARARGCDVVVLDDAFQHRWARRIADVVLVAAEQWPVRGRALPIGPYREPLSALRRATLVIVTRKTAAPAEAEGVARAVAASTSAPVVRIAFALDALRRVGEASPTPPPDDPDGAGRRRGWSWRRCRGNPCWRSRGSVRRVPSPANWRRPGRPWRWYRFQITTRFRGPTCPPSCDVPRVTTSSSVR
jgi:tetraacyldisaccharide 4'-kinase